MIMDEPPLIKGSWQQVQVTIYGKNLLVCFAAALQKFDFGLLGEPVQTVDSSPFGGGFCKIIATSVN